MYSDTLFAITVSRRSNRCAHIFATNFSWSCSSPMKLKSEAHEAWSLIFQWDEVPPAVLCDNAKEMVLGKFMRKLKETSSHLRQMEPFKPWSNAAKREINKLKKGLVVSSLSLAPQTLVQLP